MKRLDVKNPFGAPVWYKEITGSTMDDARSLCDAGSPHGTVIVAGSQTQGVGRSGRVWVSPKGNLTFTVLLRYPQKTIPAAPALRAGLAAARALESCFPVLRCAIKWPNDILLRHNDRWRKVSGILAAASGGAVFIGIGVNLGADEFSPELRDKAVSIIPLLAAGGVQYSSRERVTLLEKILFYLRETLEGESWQSAIEARLYKKGEAVRFIAGAPPEYGFSDNAPARIFGTLSGIAKDGSLLLAVDGKITAFACGELDVY
ncbi:MAG: biotin--[acetyl-CoA-carboxylase] ligase [Treponema sp.]|jgi:BirA family biotin operon repressor/biotin-[acetyl-CoA-carboxylase] ligase|nr:biotin--[acetyl-CoA-carboxylase] ligase [Treponema sp.]